MHLRGEDADNFVFARFQIDSKFTTTTQIVKLVGSHTISKITLRIGDLKRTKMVRTINIYYNNRTVQAVVELKNKPGKLQNHLFGGNQQKTVQNF